MTGNEKENHNDPGRADLGQSVEYYFTLRREDGTVLEACEPPQRPRRVILGNHEILPGLERLLLDLEVGQSRSGLIHPNDAWRDSGDPLGRIDPDEILSATVTLCSNYAPPLDASKLSFGERVQKAREIKDRANVALSSGDYEVSHRLYRNALDCVQDLTSEAIQQDPDALKLLVSLYLNDSCVQLQRKEPHAALVAAKEAIKLNPCNPKAHFRAGLAALAYEAHEEAKVYLQEADRLAPRDPAVLRELRQCDALQRAADAKQKQIFSRMFG